MTRCSHPYRAARATRGRVFCKLLYVFKQVIESKTAARCSTKISESTLYSLCTASVHHLCALVSSLERAAIGVCNTHLGRIAGTALTHPDPINPCLKADTKIGFHAEAPSMPDPHSSPLPSAWARYHHPRAGLGVAGHRSSPLPCLVYSKVDVEVLISFIFHLFPYS
jgi:hypothetical protein